MSGARRGELLGLRWTDLDVGSGVCSVRQSLVAIHHAVRIETPKSGHGRSIQLDAETVSALKAHRAQQAVERLAWGPAWTDSGLVFTREDGAAYHPDSFSKMFRMLSDEAGVPPIRLHDLRHGHATMALRAGVHPKIVSERLGHADIGITLNIYSHVTPELDREAAETVARMIAR